MAFMYALPGAVAEGLIWGLMAIGVYISYKILDIADLTVDGSICTGACVCAMLLGRVLSGIVKALILAPGTTTLAAWATASFVTALPGIILHLLLVPALVTALTKSRILRPRYSEV